MARPTVIIPVYNAFRRLRDCLASVVETAPEASVLVIDDASSDPGIAPFLDRWETGSPRHRLLRNRANVGFVASANRAISACDGPVILLNSDTVVTAGWLEAMQRCLESDERIATATPWSNNGEIVSIPEFCVNNPVPDEPQAFADAARASHDGRYPELPTAVGFCMAISRPALDRIGLFDEATFGHGYGEENDFCMRAMAAGMRNVLCDDAFVAHHGGASFAPRGLHPDAESMGRLLVKHPHYAELIATWIQADPLADRRAALLAELAGNDPVSC